jgi:hypothetical protein
MIPKNQITILKSLKAIEGLSKSASITTLLNSELGFNSIVEDIKTMRYKLSIIEQLIDEIKMSSQTKE